ncbi:MAG: type II CAAX endopeptidase family protein [Pseudomonadota bacterium]
MTSRFTAYVAACAPFAPRATLWRMLLVLIAAILGQVVATVVLFPAFAFAASRITGAPFGPTFNDISLLTTPLGLVAALSSFAGSALFVWAAVRWLHKIDPRSLLSFAGRFDWRDMGLGFAAVLAIGAVAVAVTLPFQDYTPNAPWSLWLVWALPVLLVTFIQVFTEELIFRGYLQSQLAARFASPLICIGGPSLLFGAAHIGNAAAFGSNAWLVLLAPTLVGLIAADITIRTGGIGAATGIHLGNNIIGLLFVAVPGPFGVVSLYLHPIDLADASSVRPLILINLAVIVIGYISYLAVTRGYRRRLQQPSDVFK